jgi:hypothetical protein
MFKFLNNLFCFYDKQLIYISNTPDLSLSQ